MSTSTDAHAGASDDCNACGEVVARKLLESAMPCATIDPAGTVIGASPGLSAILPQVLGQSVATVFHIDAALLSSHARVHTPVYGMYADASGQLIPVVLQALFCVPQIGDAMLVGVTDGGPFREAESDRFESTSYTVLRVSGGVVRFANSEAMRTLRLSSLELLGRPLVDLFDAGSREALCEGLAACERDRCAVPLNVCIAAAAGRPPKQVRLLLTPDTTPDRKMLGVIAVIQLTAVDHVRDEIRKIMIEPLIASGSASDRPASTWRTRFRSIVEKIQELTDFDHVIFGVYADNLRLFRAVAIEPGKGVQEPPEDKLWPARWMDLPEWIGPWLAGPETYIPDTREFTERDKDLHDSEIVQRYRDYGIVSSVTLPTSGSGGTTSSLTLCSMHENRYGAADLALLRDLDLEPVLLRFEQELRAERDAFADRMRTKLATSKSLADTAAEIVTDIAEHFKWDYVGLFRVNRHRQHFKLVQQHASKSEFGLSPGYEQPIIIGMLAKTLKEGDVLVVDDVGAPGVEQHGYIRLNPALRSAMCIPLRLNRRVRWLIDGESASTRAFRGPDRDEIIKVVELIEDGLTQRMLTEIKDTLFHASEQGVVVVGLEGAILEMNEVAGKLLGTTVLRPPEGSPPVLISRYASKDHPDAADVLEGRTTQARMRIELQGDDGVLRAVLATRRELEPTFDTAVWLFTDIQTNEWNRDLRFLREIVSDVAQQTRTPLTLASTLARQLPRLFTSVQTAASTAMSDPDAMAQRLVAEIGKADITFERLAEGLSIREEPRRVEERVDVIRCLEDVLASLPERDRRRVQDPLPKGPVVVSGDPGRLTFVFRSIIGFLLRVLTDDDTNVVVGLDGDPDWARLNLGLSEPLVDMVGAERPGPRDELWRADREARGDASLSLDAVVRVVEAHGGTLDKRPGVWPDRQPSPPWRSFQVSLPRLHEARSLS